MPKKKLIIELPHPEEELRTLSKALKALCQPGLSRQEIQKQRHVIKEAKASQKVMRAYVQYLKLRVNSLDQQLTQPRGSSL
jgi:hypothetical protein